MQERTVVITGASSGVGLAAAEQFARLGWNVVVVGRNGDRLTAAVDRVRAAGDGREVGHFQADFARLDDVRALAAYLLVEYPAIDVLANNAGAIAPGHTTTVDGFELTIQSNHLAPFLLTNLLRERLRDARVVNTASDAHRMGALNPDDLVHGGGWRAYGASKAASILFTTEAARRWPDITSTAFHPGVVRSNFGAPQALTAFFYRYAPFLTSPEKAGALLVWLASEPTVTQGGYYVGRSVSKPARHAVDPILGARLWEASAKAVGLP